MRQAMTSLAEDDVITFDPSISGTITLGSSLPPINVDNILILGPVSLSVTIDGNSQYQIFNIQADRTKIRNLILNNGANASFGGAVYVAPTLSAELKNLTVNACSGSLCQNPVYIDNSAFAHLINPSFTSGSGADLYIANGSAILENRNLLSSPSLFIDGTGDIVNKGPGPIHYTAFSNPIAILLDNASGVCTFVGNTSSILINNGSLQGNYSAAYIADMGTVLPGTTAIGSITTSGDYIQSSSGNLQIKITPTGTSDTINAGGNVYSEGVLTLLPQTGSYLSGTSYTIITAAGTINTPFSKTVCSVADFPISILYHNQTIEVLITDNFVVD